MSNSKVKRKARHPASAVVQRTGATPYTGGHPTVYCQRIFPGHCCRRARISRARPRSFAPAHHVALWHGQLVLPLAPTGPRLEPRNLCRSGNRNSLRRVGAASKSGAIPLTLGRQNMPHSLHRQTIALDTEPGNHPICSQRDIRRMAEALAFMHI